MPESRGGRTLVFTDIEGSTALLRELEGSYALALRVHRRMLERCFEARGGTEAGTDGDGLFYLFPTPADAVDAAIEGQRKVEHYDWPDGIRLRVRMGIHTGQMKVSGGVHVGLAIHEASRICTAAHGGQILCSAAVAVALDERVCLRDLGEYVLRGFPDGGHLFQIEAEGLDREFPPPRGSVRHGGVRVALWFREGARPGLGPPDELCFCGLDGEPLGDGVSVEVVPTSEGHPGAFRLVVSREGQVEEEYDGLSSGGASDAATIVNAHSRLVRIVKT
ncbi:MAG: adenylate/guanylate cyclase domain-containing protein [Acidimicrobiales bacterium]